MQTPLSPEFVLDTSDPGDSVQQRFRYQNTYAAIASCSLVANMGIQAVFCEHHEDVLVKFADDTFEGIQVKTRESHLPGFTFSDPAIQNAIRRFICLELKYPGRFRSFKIVSNNGFAKRTGDNLTEMVQIAASAKNHELQKKGTRSNKFINESCKKLKCDASLIIKVLAKIILRPDFANLSDIKKNLAYELQRLPGMGDQTLGKLNDIADKLILRAYNAASKGEEEIMEAFLFGTPFEEAQKEAILANKTITIQQVNDLIQQELANPIVHFLKDSTSLFGKEIGIKILEKKLDAGGVSSGNVTLLKDQKYSFETYISKLTHKLGVNLTKAQYDQLQLIVNTICQEVYDQQANNNNFDGTRMLTDVRTRLVERLSSDASSFKEFKYEHLLGMVAVLTEDCRVWWSKPFNIQEHELV